MMAAVYFEPKEPVNIATYLLQVVASTVHALQHELERNALFLPVFNEDPIQRGEQRETFAL